MPRISIAVRFLCARCQASKLTRCLRVGVKHFQMRVLLTSLQGTDSSTPWTVPMLQPCSPAVLLALAFAAAAAQPPSPPPSPPPPRLNAGFLPCPHSRWSLLCHASMPHPRSCASAASPKRSPAISLVCDPQESRAPRRTRGTPETRSTERSCWLVFARRVWLCVAPRFPVACSPRQTERSGQVSRRPR